VWDVPRAPTPAAYPLEVRGRNVKVGWTIDPVEAGVWQLEMGQRTVMLAGAGEMDAPGPVSLGTLRQVAVLPDGPRLAVNYPNPFNSQTMIAFVLGAGERARVSVFDMLGQRVCCLVDEDLAAGVHRVRWDGRDQAGADVASGVYLCVLRTEAGRQVRRMALIR